MVTTTTQINIMDYTLPTSPDGFDFEAGFDAGITKKKSAKLDVDSIVSEAAKAHGVDPELIRSIIKFESGGKSKATSSKGAKGLMQLMPGTAKEMGVEDITDPYQNIMGGTKYIAQQLSKTNGDIPLALARYNAGPTAVKKHGGVPPYKETQDYVKKVHGEYKKNKGIKPAKLDFNNFDFEAVDEPSVDDRFDFEGTGDITLPAIEKPAPVPDLGIDLAPTDLAPEGSNLPEVIGGALEIPSVEKQMDKILDPIVGKAKKVMFGYEKIKAGLIPRKKAEKEKFYPMPPDETGQEALTSEDKVKVALQALEQTMGGVKVAKEVAPEMKARADKPQFLEPVGEDFMKTLGTVMDPMFIPGRAIAQAPGAVTEADILEEGILEKEEASMAGIGGLAMGETAQFFHDLGPEGTKKVNYKKGELKPKELGRVIGESITTMGIEMAGAQAILKGLGLGVNALTESRLWRFFEPGQRRLAVQTAEELAKTLRSQGVADEEILKALRRLGDENAFTAFKRQAIKRRGQGSSAEMKSTKDFLKDQAEAVKRATLKKQAAKKKAPAKAKETTPVFQKPPEVKKPRDIGPKPPEPKTALGKDFKAELEQKKKPGPLAKLAKKETEITKAPEPKIQLPPPAEKLPAPALDTKKTGDKLASKYGVEYVGPWPDMGLETFNMDIGVKGQMETFYTKTLDEAALKEAVEKTKKKWGISDRRIASKPLGGNLEKRKGERRDTALRKAVDQMSPEEKRFVIPELRRMNKEKVKEIAKLKKAIISDPLTGLRNREGISKVIDRAKESGKETHYTFFDLVGFKGINDNIGYSAGDQALEHVGNAMKKLGLKGARTGGDEFGFVSNTPEEAAANVEKLKEYFNKNQARIKDKAGNEFDVDVLFRHGTAKVDYAGKDVPAKTKAAQDLAESKKVTEPAEWKRGKDHPGLTPVLVKPALKLKADMALEKGAGKPKRRILKLEYTDYRGDKTLTTKSYVEYKDLKVAKQHEGLYNIIDKENKTVGQYAGMKGAISAIDSGNFGGVIEPKRAKVSKAGANIRTFRGFVKHMGKIDKLNYGGEVRQLPKASQFLFKKGGVPIDDAVTQLIDDGWLDKGTTVADLLEQLRTDESLLSRDRITRDVSEKKEFEKTKAEKKFEAELEDPDTGPMWLSTKDELVKSTRVDYEKFETEEEWTEALLRDHKKSVQDAIKENEIRYHSDYPEIKPSPAKELRFTADHSYAIGEKPEKVQVVMELSKDGKEVKIKDGIGREVLEDLKFKTDKWYDVNDLLSRLQFEKIKYDFSNEITPKEKPTPIEPEFDFFKEEKVPEKPGVKSLPGLPTAKDIVKQYRERYGPNKPIVLTNKDGTRGIVIHKAVKKPERGGFQTSFWDKRGFSGDTWSKTEVEAVQENKSSFKVLSPESFDKISKTRMFQKYPEAFELHKKRWEGGESDGSVIELGDGKAPTQAEKDAVSREEGLETIAQIRKKAEKTEGIFEKKTLEKKADHLESILPKAKAKKETKGVEVIDPNGMYVDWSQTKTTKTEGMTGEYFGVYNKDKSFKGWKNKTEIERIKKAKGKPTLNLKQDILGKQRPDGMKKGAKAKQQGLGLKVEEEGSLFKGTGGTTLYSGIPIHELAKTSKILARIYEEHVGEPIWKLLSETMPEGAGKRSKIIDAINKGIILDYRKDPDFLKLRDDTMLNIELARKNAKRLAEAMKKFPRAEQVRVSQIIKGSITQAPERYKEAFEAVEKFKTLEKELQRLGILGPDNIFRQLTRKELADKFKEVKKFEDDIAKYRKRLEPIIKRGKVIKRSSEKMFEEVKNVITKTKTGNYKTDASKWKKKNEDRIHQALVDRGFGEGEATQMIERVKQSVVEIGPQEGTLKEVTTTLEKVITKTITHEIERIKTFSRSYMARAKASILKDIKTAHQKRNEVLNRIQTHYKMSGKQYLRRAYKAIETEENFLARLMGYATKRPRLKKGYNIKRKELTKLYRQQLGEIQEAPYLVYKGLSEEYHDMFLMELFNRISETKKWAVSPQEWDNIMHIKSRASQVEHYKDFKPLPMSDKLGKLSGAMVDPYIWDDLNESVKLSSDILKAYDKLLNLWKIGKVPFNPATQSRNMLSNAILAYFAGVSPWRIDIYARAAKDLLTKAGYWEEADQKTALFGKEWIGGEVEEFLKDVSEMKEGGGSFLEQSANVIKHLLNKPLEVYQGIEQFFKLVVYTHQRQAGATIEQAAKHAEEWIFNYQKVPPAIRWAKRWYSPFITFCCSGDTEILTDSGWKLYNNLDRSDLTIGYNIKTKVLSWQEIDGINIFPYSGEMISVKSRSLDILMTPNHRNVVERNHYKGPRGNQKKIPYETIVEAQDLKQQDCIIVAGKYEATKEKTIQDDIVRLVGWLVTDGYVVSCRNAFHINQTNPKGQIEIEKLRVRLGINNYNVQNRRFESGNGVDKAYYIPAHIRDKVVAHVDENKCLTVGFLRKLTKRQLEILYNTMMLADGHNPRSKKTNPVFTQNNNQTAANFQILCVMLGKQCGWCKKSDGDGLSLTVTKGRKRQIKRNLPEKIQYDGIVWCPTTKDGTWVARRNGKVFITGNSYKALPRFAETAVKRPWKIAVIGSLLFATEEITRRMYGETKEDVEREKRVLPDYMRKTILPGQLSHLRIPMKGKYRRSKYLDLSFILPWGDVAEQWGQSHLVGRPFLPSHPLYIAVAEVGFNEIMFTGQELTSKDLDEGSDYLKAIGMQLWRQAAPSLAGSYSYNKLISAIYGERDWALRERSVGEAVFDVFLGIKIRSIDYNEERGRRVKGYKRKIDEIRERFTKDYEKIFIRNPTPDYENDQRRYLKLVKKKDELITRIMDKITEIEQ